MQRKFLFFPLSYGNLEPAVSYFANFIVVPVIWVVLGNMTIFLGPGLLPICQNFGKFLIHSKGPGNFGLLVKFLLAALGNPHNQLCHVQPRSISKYWTTVGADTGRVVRSLRLQKFMRPSTPSLPITRFR